MSESLYRIAMLMEYRELLGIPEAQWTREMRARYIIITEQLGWGRVP